MTDAPLRVVTNGTVDVFHIGHLNILKRAVLHGDQFFVGASSDGLNQEKIVRHIRPVSDVLGTGDNREDMFDHLSGICEVVYLPGTQAISTTDTIMNIE